MLANIFRKLFGIRKGTAIPEPIAISRVLGLTLTLEKKNGVLRTTRKPGEKLNTPASTDYFYEVNVIPDGTNLEYPKATMVTRFTVALSQEYGCGSTDDTTYAPAGSHWQSFELVEYVHTLLQNEGIQGRHMPPHHHLSLRGIYTDSTGKTGSLSLRGIPRKSDRNSPAWAHAIANPVNYM